MLKQGISFLFFKNRIFLTVVCITIPAFISTAELLSGISPLISMVKKKRKRKCADKWRLDSGYISSVITLLYLDIETEKLLPIAAGPWGLVSSVNGCCLIAFFTGGCRYLFGPTNTQVDN